ncbi:hypothetical protein [Buchananella hordeovulneris]|nr:hypothetical protein [Buchananella hordeovulneris]
MHPLPDGVTGATPACRRNKTVEAFQERRTAYRADILVHRVEFSWRT